MQEQPILSFLAYVWALGIVPTTTSVSADRNGLNSESDETRIFDADAIKTEAELQAALSDPETVAITLASDIITLENLVVNRNDSIELNLNGFKIASLTKNARVIDVQAGDIAILGLGSIVATGVGASAVRVKGAITADNVNYSHVLIGADVTLYAPNYYGIFVTTSYNAAYGVTIDFYGSIIAHDGICIHNNIGGRGDNVPRINLQDGSKIIADENEGSAVCAFGNGIWEIGAAELNGGTGLNIKSGSINLRQTSLIATGDDDVLPGGGAAIRFEDNFAHRIKLKIFGGSCLSVQGYTFYEHVEQNGTSSLNSLEIYDGVFSGQLGICFGIAPRGSESSSTRIYGGKFNADVSQYLAPEHHVEPDGTHGEFTVIDDTEPTQVLDKAAQIGFAKADLEDLLSIAKRYTKPSYAGNELGELQATVNKIIGAIKRAIKASEKLLESSDLTIVKIKTSTRRLEDHLGEIRSIEDGMRAEISEAIKFSKLDQSRYTPDSFLDLSLAAADAEQLLAADFVTLVELQDMLGVIDAAKIMLEESEDYVENAATVETSLEDNPIEPVTESLEVEEQLSDSIDPVVETVSELPEEQPPLPDALPLPELPLRPAPKLFPAPAETPSTTDIKQALESFADAEETVEPVDPIEAAFAFDDLEIEEMSEVEEFVSQLQTAKLISEPLPDESEVLADELPAPIIEPIVSAAEPSPAPDFVAQPEPPVPTFVDPEMLAAEQSLRDLLNAISALDPADYTAESYTILARTATMAGNLLSGNASHVTTAVLLSAFSSVNLAYERLAKKAENPTNTALETIEVNLRSMLDAVQDLTINDYEASSAEQFGELQVAIAKAKAMLARDLPNLTDILNVMDEIKLATSGLKGANTPPESSSAAEKTVTEAPAPAVESSTYIVHQQPTTQPQSTQPNNLNWNDFSEVINDIRVLNADEYTSASYQKLLAVLENAKIVSNKADLTQSEIDEMVFELNLAMLALERPNAPRLSTTQDFSRPETNVPNSVNAAPTNPSLGLANDDTITPSLLMSMMAGAYAGLATYRRSRLEAKKRKQPRSA